MFIAYLRVSMLTPYIGLEQNQDLKHLGLKIGRHREELFGEIFAKYI